MKNILPIIALLFNYTMTFAQNTGMEKGSQGELIPVNLVFLVIGVVLVSAFVFLVIYSLSKAVRTLSIVVASKR